MTLTEIILLLFWPQVFTKQTRSPGIKSCYDIREISLKGTFFFQASANTDEVLVLELVKVYFFCAKLLPFRQCLSLKFRLQGDGIKTEPLEYMLDLRSKILMTEIPEELEQEMKISVLVDAFVKQLEVLQPACLQSLGFIFS